MSTILKVNIEDFSPEVTQRFLKDLKQACMKMDLQKFEALFENYNLESIDEIDQVRALIRQIATHWKKNKTEMTSMKKYDAKCIFCLIGKTVTAYEWTYMHRGEHPPMNMAVYSSKAAFVVTIVDGRLTDFGVCNAFTNKW